MPASMTAQWLGQLEIIVPLVEDFRTQLCWFQRDFSHLAVQVNLECQITILLLIAPLNDRKECSPSKGKFPQFHFFQQTINQRSESYFLLGILKTEVGTHQPNNTVVCGFIKFTKIQLGLDIFMKVIPFCEV